MQDSLIKSLPQDCSTKDVARALGLAVRSVQLMVDRGELLAWKTPGGHRRIARDSVERWLVQHRHAAASAATPLPVNASAQKSEASTRRARVLLIEDSVHFQNLVRLLMQHHFPQLELHVAEDGIVGLAMAGELKPEVLLVDILLPGVDGATLIARLRSHPQFRSSRVIVVTSLDEAQRGPYAFALEGLPVVHKTRLAQELPSLVADTLA